MASGKTMKTTITLYGKQDASLKRAFQAAQSGGAQAADKLSGVFKKAAAAASAAFAAIKVGDFMKDAMDTYATFEQSMANTAAIAGASADDYEMMAKAARDAGKATAFEASEAADALGYMALAGWDAQTSTKALMPVLKLAEATQMDLANTSDLVTDSMSAMGLEVEDLNDYLDVLITTNNKANTTAGALMEAMIGAGGATRAAGIDVRDTATALGILANNGKKGSEAGTALNSIIARMTTNDKALTAAEKLNVKIFDEETGKFRGLETVLKDVNAAFANLTQEDRLFYQKALGGTNYFSQLGYLLDGVKDRYYDFSQAQDMLADKGKNVSKIFTEVPDIFGNLSDAAKDALNELGAVYKYEDDDALLDTNFILEQLADSLYNYSDAEREAYLKTIAGEGRWQDLNDVLVTMYDTLDENSSAWSKLHGELDEAGGSLDEMWKTATDTLTYAKSVWNSAVSDFKIGLAEAFGPKLKNILNKASARFPQITENLSGIIEKIPFDKWADKIGGMVDATFDFFGSITEGKGVFESLGDAIAGAMASGADGQMFGNWELRQKIQDVKDFAASIDENIGKSWDRIKGIGVWLKDEFLQVVNTVRESFEKHGPSLEKLKKLGENIKKVADDMFGGAQKTVEDLNDSSLPTLTDMLATIADKAVDVANAFLEWEGAVPTITTIVTAIVSLKVITTIVAGVKSAAAAFGAFKAVVTGWNLAGQLSGISTWAYQTFAIELPWAFTRAGGAIASFGSKAATALSGAASSVGSFMTADMGASLAAGGATAGATIATALVGSIVAALGGLEVGKKIGAMIFPDDADIYESYSGLSGTWQ
ncbi:MAG: phage tail tape measure protein, partial [Lachnospiraceae bacterium]|nr:phage tail tape measure protein [Lachnospiraceae bacterium]